MASFKETRNLVLECYVDGIIDEDDFMLLYDINQSKNPEFPHENYELFKFDALDPVECAADFFVSKNKIFQGWLMLWVSLRSLSASKGVYVMVLKDCVCFCDVLLICGLFCNKKSRQNFIRPSLTTLTLLNMR